MILRLDEDLDNADWTKGTWDLPYKDVESLRAFLKRSGMSVEHFKTLPIYRFNVRKKNYRWLRSL